MILQDGFFDYLRGLDCSEVEVYAIAEGSAVFPKVPLLRIEGPIAVSTPSNWFSLYFLVYRLPCTFCLSSGSYSINVFAGGSIAGNPISESYQFCIFSGNKCS
jgi:hypothetical protein